MELKFKARFFHSFQDKELTKRVYLFRKQIFIDIHKWDLKTIGDLEKDEFDTDYAVHCVLTHQNTILGYFRCVNCTKPYLSSKKFSVLSKEGFFPTRPDFWEISRFAISKDYPKLGRFLYSLMFTFAELKKAKSLVAVVDVSHENRLKQLGIVTKRYGFPMSVGKDKDGNFIISVAGEIPLASQPIKTLEHFRKLARSIDIEDQTDVERFIRIPA